MFLPVFAPVSTSVFSPVVERDHGTEPLQFGPTYKAARRSFEVISGDQVTTFAAISKSSAGDAEVWIARDGVLLYQFERAGLLVVPGDDADETVVTVLRRPTGNGEVWMSEGIKRFPEPDCIRVKKFISGWLLQASAPNW